MGVGIVRRGVVIGGLLPICECPCHPPCERSGSQRWQQGLGSSKWSFVSTPYPPCEQSLAAAVGALGPVVVVVLLGAVVIPWFGLPFHPRSSHFYPASDRSQGVVGARWFRWCGRLAVAGDIH
jgi:hypothetical protein